MEESIKRLRSFDFFMGLGFLAVGLFVMYDGYVAWTAPALSVVPKPSNPGVTTLFVGGCLVFLGLVIAVIGLRGSGNPLRIGKQAVSETIHSKLSGAAVSSWPASRFTSLYFGAASPM